MLLQLGEAVGGEQHERRVQRREAVAVGLPQIAQRLVPGTAARAVSRPWTKSASAVRRLRSASGAEPRSAACSLGSEPVPLLLRLGEALPPDEHVDGVEGEALVRVDLGLQLADEARRRPGVALGQQVVEAFQVRPVPSGTAVPRPRGRV